MKKSTTLLFISLIVSNIFAQKEFADRYWFGILEEVQLPLNLHFETRNDSVFPVLYSPMQSSEKIEPTSY